MSGMVYEVHSFPNSELPFIFHKKCSATKQARFVNWHDNIEILLCTEGMGTVHSGGFFVPFCPGDIFVVNPDTPHTLSSDAKVRYQCLIIDNRFCTENGIPIQSLVFQERIRDEEITELFRNVVLAHEGNDDFTVLDIRLSVLKLLYSLCKHYATASQRLYTGYVKKALEYIRQNLIQTLTLDEIAQYVGISKYHLSRQFRELTGTTVIRTINLIRCVHAQQLLETGMTVSQAARSSGFDNLSYFSRTFQACMGHLPSSVKK